MLYGPRVKREDSGKISESVVEKELKPRMGAKVLEDALWV